ncbi:MAG: HlyD family efflux transporter periplasmic adaptor subunit [Parvibaculaceae bacterium]|nr:HlyD family efflux transporter periplasmic adaptor subunit [Parvibaculaceae bacterium]
MMVLGLILVFGTFTRRERVTGYLSPAGGITRIYAPQPGVVTAFPLTEGMLVARGDLLFTIEGKRYRTAESGDASEDVVKALDRQEGFLSERIDRQVKLMTARTGHYRDLAEKMASEVRALEDQMDQQRHILALVREDHEAARVLVEKGHATRTGLRRLQQQVVAHEQHLKELETEHSAKKINLARNAYEAAQSPALVDDQIAQLKISVEEIRQRIIEMETKRTITIRAPVAGRVSFLQAATGAVVGQHIPLLSLVPEPCELLAELYVPSRATAFIEVGQEVRLFYDPYPFQKYGSFAGHIVEVADSPLSPSEINGVVKSDQPCYRVKVSLDHQHVNAYGVSYPLRPGTALSADIIVDRRPFYEWALDPFYSLKGRMS